MRRNALQIVVTFLLGGLILSPASAQESGDDVVQWDFNVFLDDKRVGKHRFVVSEENGTKQVRSEASFLYKIFFISAYRYEHQADERWAGNCLADIAADTNVNGKRTEVSGEQSNIGFVVDSGDGSVALPECVMTFAYWNPIFLEQPRLLNPQTGEYVDVVVEEIGPELLEVRGLPVSATRFRLTASKIDLTLWYSPDDEWLALESVAKGGRIIRYELS
jgi:hypothetical protein